MKSINNYLSEALIKKDTVLKGYQKFTDEELRYDYNTITYATTKAEKLPIAQKYGVKTIRIKNIQIAILEKLRENRHNKKEFTNDDIKDFFRLDIPERYERMKEYLDKEPIEFIEYLLKYLEGQAKRIRYPYLSYSDKALVNRISKIKNYLYVSNQ